MSIREQILQAVSESLDEQILNLFKEITARYSVPLTELKEMWKILPGSSDGKTVVPISTTPPSTPQYNEVDLISCTLVELKAICKSQKIKKYSKLKKFELIASITGNSTSDIEATAKLAATKTKTRTKSKFKAAPTPVIKNIPSKSTEIKRNVNGDYMHTLTNLIFDKETKQVIGKYVEGEYGFLNLSLQDIEICKCIPFSNIEIYELLLSLHSLTN